MIKKMLIVGLLVASLLSVTAFSVSAADEEKTFEDPENDVLDLIATENQGKNVTTNSKPNIDITTITYTKTGKQAKISLEVKGKIEDRGDISDQESFDFVGYQIFFLTNESYEINYVNKNATLNGDIEGITYKIENSGRTLSLTFDLNSAGELYGGIEIFTFDISSFASMYSDDFSNIPEEIIVDAHGPYNAKVNTTINFKGSVVGGTGPYTWEWDFDEDFETDSYEQNPSYTYTKEDEYIVTLMVTDDIGYQGIDSTTVYVNASGNTNGNNNKSNNKDSGSGLIVFIVLILIVVIAVVAVVIYIMRR